MAEVIGVVSGVIGIVTAAIQTIDVIQKLIQDIKDGPRSLERLREELHTLSAVLMEVDKIPSFNSYTASSTTSGGRGLHTKGSSARKDNPGPLSNLPAPVLAIQGCLDELRFIYDKLTKLKPADKEKDAGETWSFSKLRTGYRMSREDKELAPAVLSLERRKMTLCLVLNTTITKSLMSFENLPEYGSLNHRRAPIEEDTLNSGYPKNSLTKQSTTSTPRIVARVSTGEKRVTLQRDQRTTRLREVVLATLDHEINNLVDECERNPNSTFQLVESQFMSRLDLSLIGDNEVDELYDLDLKSMRRLWDIMDDRRKKEFAEDLGTITYPDDIIGVPAASESTCEWICDDPEYIAWKENPKSACLHVRGKPGQGKTVLACHAYNRLVGEVDHQSGVIYHICNGRNHSDKTALAILRNLIHMFMYNGRHHLVLSVAKRLGWPSREHVHFSQKFLWTLFVEMLKTSDLKTVYCIVDGLDEYDQNSVEDFLELMTHLLDGEDALNGTVFKLLLTSRPEEHILDALKGHSHNIRIDSKVIEKDIEKLVIERMERLKRKLRLKPQEEEEFRQDLVKRAEGMFLWVTLALGMLERARGLTTKRLKAMAASLPPGLNDLYSTSLAKIDREFHDEDDRTLVQKVLTWVTLAERPLTLYELREALAVEKGTSALEEDNVMRNIRDVQGICGAFIEIVPAGVEEEKSEEEEEDEDNEEDEGKDDDQEDGDENDSEEEEEEEEEISEDEEEEEDEEDEELNDTVRLIHQSAKEFLLGEQSKHRIDPKTGHTYIAETCVTYVLYDDFDCDIIDTETSAKDLRHFERRVRKHRFLSYGSYYLNDHVNAAVGDTFDADTDLGQMVLRLFCDSPKHFDNWRQNLHYFEENEVHCSRGYLPLHTAFQFSILPLAKFLISSGKVDVNAFDGEGDAPFHQLVSCNSEAGCYEKFMQLCEILIQYGADINIQNTYGFTPFIFAVHRNVDTVKGILKHGADPYTPDFLRCGRTAVHQVAGCENGHLDVLSFLIEELKVDVNLKTAYRGHRTLLHEAIRSGVVETVEYLIKHGANLEAPEDEGDELKRPLHIAVSLGHKEMVTLLLDGGADIDSVAADKDTPLIAAIQAEEEECASILIERGASVHCSSNLTGYSALTMASSVQKENKIVQKLIEAGADVNHVAHLPGDDPGDSRSPLHLSVNNTESLKLLLKAGADPEKRTPEGWTPFLLISKDSGSLEQAQEILKYDIDPTVRDAYGRSALHLAAEYGHLELCKFLCNTLFAEKPELITATDNFDETALSMALHNAQTDCADIIRSAGCLETNPALQRRHKFHTAIKEGNIETVRALVLDDGISVGLIKNACSAAGCEHGFCGSPALHIASALGHTEIVKFLLENGADVHAVCLFNKENPLHCAIRGYHVEVTRLLLDAGANPNAPELLNKCLPIHICASKDDSTVTEEQQAAELEIMKLLLSAGADLHAKHLKTRSVLLTAIISSGCNFKLLEFLAEKFGEGAVNMRDPSDGRTLLMDAACAGRKDAVEWLLERGADPTLKCDYGMTARLHAEDNEENDIEKLIEEAEKTWRGKITAEKK